jgi:two-component system sensor histidine kinase YesM
MIPGSDAEGGRPDHSVETVFYHLLHQEEVAEERNKIAEKQRQEAELYALQSQIDPHFLYNALDSIRGYAMLKDMDEIAEITEALSRIFRNMIGEKQAQIPLRQEMDNINSYMRIQQFRFHNKFQYTFDVDEGLPDHYMVPRMVLQPLVENSIVHGLECKVEGGWIRVSAYVTQRRFVVVVTDNGVGISAKRLEYLRRALRLSPVEHRVGEEDHQTGIALININRRIKLNYGGQYGITLSSTPGVRTTSEVVLPLLLHRR